MRILKSEKKRKFLRDQRLKQRYDENSSQTSTADDSESTSNSQNGDDVDPDSSLQFVGIPAIEPPDVPSTSKNRDENENFADFSSQLSGKSIVSLQASEA